jgi:inorganic pyrophosphatase
MHQLGLEVGDGNVLQSCLPLVGVPRMFLQYRYYFFDGVRVLLLEDLISDRGREHVMTAVSTPVSEPIKVAISSFDLIGSTHDAVQPIPFQEGATKPIELDAVVEVPRGSFLKRGSTGKVDFISPVPCPFNYGSVPQYLGREGDLLDAVVLGPRLPYGSHVRVKVWGAVILTDHGMSDDKLICSSRPLTGADRRRLLRFFHFYAKCKGLLNFCRRRPGRNACEGWCEAEQAMARARPRPATWQGPPVKF